MTSARNLSKLAVDSNGDVDASSLGNVAAGLGYTALNAASNLSDVASASTSRTNLGLAIGTDVQAYNSNLNALSTNGTGTGNSQYVQRDSSARIPIGTNWSVFESAGVLYFRSGTTNLAKLDASGNLTVAGNVTAYGTI